ncbi:ATP-binding protein [Belliella sp. DSM 111904]|uniref:histidine kinase n=1 Tax=Belliella filtrata TaxID=2923435 RepID=A0ABS9V5I2_9BACT|nr:ATP-binding protein [Belliella filtrata]MCH7411459.1 ATP-binding protein [Belliella filtrata]
MAFKSFSFGIFVRVVLIVLTAIIGGFAFYADDAFIQVLLCAIILLILTLNLIGYVSKTNRKISLFLESIRYSDFSSSFSKDSDLGQSFEELNRSFNEVIEAFKKTRADKEQQMIFLQIMIQHINTGIISFDSKGRIGVINGSAKQLLQIPQFKDIHDLGKLSKELLRTVLSLQPGSSFTMKVRPDIHLNVQSAAFVMDGNNWTLLSFQNIKEELQKNELEAWQNLTKVLRHEIMNSMTPIASLASSLGVILEEDLVESTPGELYLNRESYLDLSEGLETISKRSMGLVDFVNAYRDYTNTPTPVFSKFPIKQLLEDVGILFREELKKSDIILKINVSPEGFYLHADRELIQMILINLIKNAMEALTNSNEKIIEIKAGLESGTRPFIQVIDSGEGIVPEALERIFVPFFTTKKTGSGIGLAISRQIMHLHKGRLEVISHPDKFTMFTLSF